MRDYWLLPIDKINNDAESVGKGTANGFADIVVDGE